MKKELTTKDLEEAYKTSTFLDYLENERKKCYFCLMEAELIPIWIDNFVTVVCQHCFATCNLQGSIKLSEKDIFFLKII